MEKKETFFLLPGSVFYSTNTAFLCIERVWTKAAYDTEDGRGILLDRQN